MAIKTNLTYKQIGERLEKFKSPFATEDIPYILLSSIGVSDTLLGRYKEGKNIVASFDGLLIKRAFAYRYVATDELLSAIDVMRSDPLIVKNKPAIIAACDGTTIVGYDPAVDESYNNRIDNIYTDYEFFTPIWGVNKVRNVGENDADVKAAYVMGQIHDEIRRYNNIGVNNDTSDLNMFMSRLLFCFFAEDTGLFDSNVFTNAIRETTQTDGSDLREFFDEAFSVMNMDIRTNVNSRYAQFPYVNGGLFAKQIEIPRMNMRIRKLILQCGELNWAKINPDIFGSMIQAVVNPELRGGLGMHYTSVSNIKKVINPLFLDVLYDEYYKLDRRQKELDGDYPNTQRGRQEYYAACKPVINQCNRMLKRMHGMKFFDPACGSGNFLIISYKELRRIETRVLKLIQQMEQAASFTSVISSVININQFYGIEINDYACDTAKLSLWLAEHQVNRQFTEDFGVNIQALPLKTNDNIVCANACRIDWNEVCPHEKDEEVYVMGNPPYLGSKLQSDEQKKDITSTFGKVKNCKILDYISNWFLIGAKYIECSNSKMALVTTNSICQGEQVAVLWPEIFKLNQNIFFAFTSFKWTNNAKYNAGVTCAIIGICDKNFNTIKRLYMGETSRDVSLISPYLTSTTETIVYKSNDVPKGLPKMCFGCMPYDHGFLLLDRYSKDEILADYPEAEKLIRRIYGSEEYINDNERYCLWIDDDQLDLAMSISPIKYRIEQTKLFRLNSTAPKLAEKPYQFREHVNDMTKIIVPRVSSERRMYIPIGYLDEQSIVSDSAFAIYDAPIYLFGILTSIIHMVWMKAVGGKLETRYRYSAQLCYNTFPFPKITAVQKSEIEDAALNVIAAREAHYENTLAEMYNPDKMPTDLRVAHHKLDMIVDRCYRREPFLNDNERLEYLFKMYEKMANKDK